MSLWTGIGLIANFIGALFGLSAMVCFAVLNNKFASLFGFLTLSYSILNIWLHVLYISGRLEIYTTSILKSIKSFAVCSMIIFFGIFTYLIFLILYWKMPFNEPISTNLFVTTVWVFVSFKYAYFLKRTSNRYCKILISSSSALLQS